MKKLQQTFSSARDKLAAKTKSIKWRMLYNTMHKIDTSADDMDWPEIIWHANVLARLVTLDNNKRVSRFAQQLENDWFKAIEQTHNELFVINYDLTADTPEHRKLFLRETLKQLHKNKSASLPVVKNGLTDVQFLDPKQYQSPFVSKKRLKKAFGVYQADDSIIGFFPNALLRTNIGRFMSTPKHEYVHLLQQTYNSALSETALKLELEHPLVNLFIPYKKRLHEQEAKIVGSGKADEAEKRFLDFLTLKSQSDDKHFD